MPKIRRPGHAVVVAYLALFVGLGTGGAWAVDKITSKDIAKNAVRAKHIKKNNVRTKQIKARAVTAKKLRHGGTLYGRAGAGADRAFLLSWPAMGLRVETHDAPGDDPFQVRIVNTNPPGGTRFKVAEPGLISPVAPGSSVAAGELGGLDARVVENGGSGRMVRLDCFANILQLGDDSFMQCTALTAGPG